MGERKGIIITVLFSLFLLSSTLGIAFASSGNWVEVARFAGGGSGFGYSPPFMIEHVSWRIRWQYNSSFGFDWQTDFTFWVIPTEYVTDNSSSDNGSIASVTSPLEKNGTLNIYEHTGIFHILTPPQTSDWTVIIEQNIESIPEFPSWAILPLFLTATLIGILVRKRLMRTSAS